MTLAPGTPLRVDDQTATYDVGGVRVSGVVPADAFGRVWRPAPVETVAGGWSLHRDSAWSATPDGPAVGTLARDGTFALSAGTATAGWVPVQIGSPGLVARGWLPEGALDSGGHGLAGGTGGTSGGAPTITIPAGTDVTALGASAVFARTTAETEVQKLAGDGDRTWIVLPTPWGDIEGEITGL